MDNSKDKSTILWDLMNTLKNALYSKDLSFSTIRLIFLKYALDNYVGAKTVEDMQNCARAQKMLAMKDVEGGIDALIPVFEYIDKAYGLYRIFSSPENIEYYQKELFGGGYSNQKKNVTSEEFKKIIDVLGSMDLEEKEGNHALGKSLVDGLIEIVETTSKKSEFAGDCATTSSLGRIAKEILKIRQDDTFCDFASGVGLSTMEITKDMLPSVNIAEISCSNAALSAMLLIMYGYDNIKIHAGDSLTYVLPDVHGNKVFVDPPLNIRIVRPDGKTASDSTYAAISNTIQSYLDENGTAVIATPSNFLFQVKKQAYNLREELVESGMLKAVVALPPLWKGTSIGTNIIILSRMKSDKVVLINAIDKIKELDAKYSIREMNLPDAIIEKIVNTIDNQTAEEGFSAVVTKQNLKEKEYNLIPANYLANPTEEETMTVYEIDSELDKLYALLKK